jgi:hypothetical protein
VIARLFPAHCAQGFGEELYVRGPSQAGGLSAKVIETVVLSSSEDGLRFARKYALVEAERYLPPGGNHPWINLRLS